MFPNSNLPNLATKTEEFIINIENNIPKPLFEMSVFEVQLRELRVFQGLELGIFFNRF